MLNVSIRRKAVLLVVVVAALVTPWASAAGARFESPGPQAKEPPALDLFGHIWSFLQRIGGKEGCGIAPSGPCVNGNEQRPLIQIKEGCRIDPSGRCVP